MGLVRQLFERTPLGARAFQVARPQTGGKLMRWHRQRSLFWLLVRWFGYGPEDDTWQHSGRLPVAAVYLYCRRKGLLPQDPDKAEPGRDAQEACRDNRETTNPRLCKYYVSRFIPR